MKITYTILLFLFVVGCFYMATVTIYLLCLGAFKYEQKKYAVFVAAFSVLMLIAAVDRFLNYITEVLKLIK